MLHSNVGYSPETSKCWTPLSRSSTNPEHLILLLFPKMELQDVEQHMGISTTVCENVCRLLKCMVTAARVGVGTHVCALKSSECAYCEASVMWHQLSAKLVQFMAPKKPVRPPDVRNLGVKGATVYLDMFPFFIFNHWLLKLALCLIQNPSSCKRLPHTSRSCVIIKKNV